MKTPPDKTISFTIISHRTQRPELRWMAYITFPAGSDETTVLPIEVTGDRDIPVASGTLEFAGQMLAVKDGMASLRYADFVKGVHSVPIWLHRDGMDPVPGGLTFA